MKANYKTANGRLMFEVTGETAKALFREIAQIQEVFDAEKSCGCCNGTDLRFLSRQVDDFDFYELACGNQECRARFSFGQAKKGGALFPKRKDEDGSYLPNRGWSKYEGGKAQTGPANGKPGPYDQQDEPPPQSRYGGRR